MSTARFEVVHSGPYKFHARFVAANNETVWVTESYRTRRAAHEACWLLTEALLNSINGNRPVRLNQVDERDHA